MIIFSVLGCSDPVICESRISRFNQFVNNQYKYHNYVDSKIYRWEGRR